MKTTMTALALLAATVAAMAQDDRQIPLMEVEGDADRDFYLVEQMNRPGELEALRDVVGSEAVPLAVEQDGPLQIALVYPSADVSDFWARMYLAFTKRLDELGIEYETTEFASRQIEHSLQATYTDQVIQDKDIWDFVLFGPSELATQADNIDKLAATDDFTTFVISFFTPPKYLENQPAGWFDFSAAEGAQLICDYMVDRLGPDQVYALNRGIPGITDNQRSGDFAACVEEKGNWELAYEHYGEYRREGGFDGTNYIMQSYPEAKIIHNANTAMAMGSVEAQLAMGMEDEIFSTGWGGTGLELEALRNGELDATPMRMGDDVGAAVAEAIKYHLEGRENELPRIFLGRITIANNEMSVDELNALEQEAFRFSGVGALER
ncbi:substrate-binding domain-containing protein [uncultured Jannaschia sp.]|uniref:substrate-binding domain-containing protein n=1 Tax=uncultured Jannaschia sp. TaxID=293347 RepID=UPI0026025CF3|nr:substrate-binding domain-containing protein [uncultured Jannaschia sp.]